MSLSLSSADLVAFGRERLLDLRDFVVVGFYRLRHARGARRAAMAGTIVVAGLGAGLYVARHHLPHHARPEMAAVVAPAAAPSPVAQAATSPAVVAAAPQPTTTADAPAAAPKIDMRVTGSIPPVDDAVKKKKKKKSKEHKPALDAKASADKATADKVSADKKKPLDAAH